jgi:hypothetical protein
VSESLGRVHVTPTPQQLRLQELASAHADEQSREAARSAANVAKREAAQEARRQAIADLHAMCEEAVLLLQESLPDLRLTESGNRVTLNGEIASLDFTLWSARPPEGDPIVVAG